MEYPLYYSTQAAQPINSTGVIADRFGFLANNFVLSNTNAVNYYVTFRSTSVATTADLLVRACSAVQLSGFLAGGYAAYSTSTGATPNPLNVTVYASV